MLLVSNNFAGRINNQGIQKSYVELLSRSQSCIKVLSMKSLVTDRVNDPIVCMDDSTTNT